MNKASVCILISSW